MGVVAFEFTNLMTGVAVNSQEGLVFVHLLQVARDHEEVDVTEVQ
jgi:hypothetical protein